MRETSRTFKGFKYQITGPDWLERMFQLEEVTAIRPNGSFIEIFYKGEDEDEELHYVLPEHLVNDGLRYSQTRIWVTEERDAEGN